MEYSTLERVPDPAINCAAQTLLDLRETWENTTQEEHRDLVHVMIQGVGIDMDAKCVLWVKARPERTAVLDPRWTVSGWRTALLDRPQRDRREHL